jgi:hypothetical protein
MEANTAISILSILAQGSIAILAVAALFVVFAHQALSNETSPARVHFGIAGGVGSFWAVFTFSIVELFFSLSVMFFATELNLALLNFLMQIGIVLFMLVIVSLILMLLIVLNNARPRRTFKDRF